MMDHEENNGPDYDEQYQEMLSLCTAWKAEWTNQGKNGPLLLNARIASQISPAQLEAAIPEYAAYQKIIEYCATALAYATYKSDTGRVIHLMHEAFHLSKSESGTATVGHEKYSRFLEEVMRRSYELLRDMNTENGEVSDASVSALIQTQRAKINKKVTFGLTQIN